MLEFNISGQTMTRIDKFNPASDSVDYLTAKFNFNSSEWNGKAKTALFRLGYVIYPVLIGSNNICKVASEVLTHGNSRYFRLHGGEFQVSVLGEYNTIKITTNEITVNFKPNGYGSTQTPAEPTAGMYEQILTAYADAQTASENAEAAANAAVEECKDTADSLANAIKGNLTGTVVRADDVSPVEHKPVVKVVCPEGVDPSSVTVKKCGKNLFNRNISSRNLDDCKSWGQRILNSTEVKKIFKPGKTYTISFEAEGLENSEYARLFASDIGFSLYCYSEEYSMIRVCLRTSTKNEDWLVAGKKITYTNTLTIPESFEKADYELFGYTQRAFDDEDNAFLNRVKFNYIQIELNETPTDYENYNGTEHTPSSDGTVEGIVSLSPTMTLLTDTEDVTIECEYNKDTGKVIEKLTNAVVALGGTVS